MMVSALALAAALPISAADVTAPAIAPLVIMQGEPVAPPPGDPDAATQQPPAPVIVLPEFETSDEAATVVDTSASAAGGTQPIVVTGELEAPEGDPAEAVNAAAFEVTQEIDDAIVEPIARAYDEGLPRPIRDGVGNFVRNIGEPINFLNFMLQFKIGKALKAAGRFAINSTIGIAGLFDHARKKPFSLPYESNGFANTLGFYGIGPGPYLYLPLIGSTTLRDLAGRFVDLSIVPNVAGKPFNQSLYTIPIGVLTSLEDRIRTDAQIEGIRAKCGDPYGATRDFYLLQRQLEIDALRGRRSTDLDEMVERLEVNCAIDVTTDGPGGINAEQFIDNNTTLTAEPLPEGAAAVPEDVEGLPEGEPAVPPRDPVNAPPADAAERAGTIPEAEAEFRARLGSCQIAEPAAWVGRASDAPTIADLESASGATTTRVVRPNEPMSMDWLSGRVTVMLDASGRIASVACG